MKRFVFTSVVAILSAGFAEASSAEMPAWLENTTLLYASHEQPFSGIAQSVRGGGYELAQGARVEFDEWYSSSVPSIYLEGITQMNDFFGLSWGIGSGEYGEKYTIDPVLKLGFVMDMPIKKGFYITFSAHNMFGGGIREKSCTANYGAIGGVQKVNCRLAASELPPEETLNYMLDNQLENWSLGIRLRWEF